MEKIMRILPAIFLFLALFLTIAGCSLFGPESYLNDLSFILNISPYIEEIITVDEEWEGDGLMTERNGILYILTYDSLYEVDVDAGEVDKEYSHAISDSWDDERDRLHVVERASGDFRLYYNQELIRLDGDRAISEKGYIHPSASDAEYDDFDRSLYFTFDNTDFYMGAGGAGTNEKNSAFVFETGTDTIMAYLEPPDGWLINGMDFDDDTLFVYLSSGVDWEEGATGDVKVKIARFPAEKMGSWEGDQTDYWDDALEFLMAEDVEYEGDDYSLAYEQIYYHGAVDGKLYFATRQLGGEALQPHLPTDFLVNQEGDVLTSRYLESDYQRCLSSDGKHLYISSLGDIIKYRLQ